MTSFKRPTARQHVAALRSTSQRYMDGMIAYSAFKRHMTHLWARVEQSPMMKHRVLSLLRESDAQLNAGAR